MSNKSIKLTKEELFIIKDSCISYIKELDEMVIRDEVDDKTYDHNVQIAQFILDKLNNL